MKTEELKSLDISGKNVLIIGCPASGKTYISNLIADDSHKIIRSDDYIQYGFAESMYKCLEDISLMGSTHTIVEGVQGYRMLRKGVELNSYFPDIVIEVVISEKTMNERYQNERDPKKIKYLQGFGKAQQKILNDYLALPNERRPQWIKVENDII